MSCSSGGEIKFLLFYCSFLWLVNTFIPNMLKTCHEVYFTFHLHNKDFFLKTGSWYWRLLNIYCLVLVFIFILSFYSFLALLKIAAKQIFTVPAPVPIKIYSELSDLFWSILISSDLFCSVLIYSDSEVSKDSDQFREKVDHQRFVNTAGGGVRASKAPPLLRVTLTESNNSVFDIWPFLMANRLQHL